MLRLSRKGVERGIKISTNDYPSKKIEVDASPKALKRFKDADNKLLASNMDIVVDREVFVDSTFIATTVTRDKGIVRGVDENGNLWISFYNDAGATCFVAWDSEKAILV